MNTRTMTTFLLVLAATSCAPDQSGSPYARWPPIRPAADASADESPPVDPTGAWDALVYTAQDTCAGGVPLDPTSAVVVVIGPATSPSVTVTDLDGQQHPAAVGADKSVTLHFVVGDRDYTQVFEFTEDGMTGSVAVVVGAPPNCHQVYSLRGAKKP